MASCLRFRTLRTGAAQTLQTEWQETSIYEKRKPSCMCPQTPVIPTASSQKFWRTEHNPWQNAGKLRWGKQMIDMCASACLIIYILLFLNIQICGGRFVLVGNKTNKFPWLQAILPSTWGEKTVLVFLNRVLQNILCDGKYTWCYLNTTNTATRLKGYLWV